MAKILKLDPHVADLIAAGEVVERPGSAVKELMENAIDAGATVVTVEIKNGGMSYIRVTDNGIGMSAEDAETAFMRHATSKLRDERGLEAIGTLGFRGEALAAISAVSRIELITRETGADEGVRLLLEGGIVTEKMPFGCPEGTTIIVKDLFFNTPARMKFMKTDRAEGASVSATVLRCGLSHPEVSVRYIKDGKEECHTPGDGRMESCIYDLLGRDFARGMIPASSEGDGVSVRGFVSSPADCRGNRNYQFFFVNGRFIKSKTLQAALEQAYKNSMFTGKFPACVLYVEVSPAAVDVNVHPTKTEVKFLYESQVFSAVHYAAKGALEQGDMRAEIAVSPPPMGKEEAEPEKGGGGTFTARPNADFYRRISAAEFQTGYSGGGFRRMNPVSDGAKYAVRDSVTPMYQTRIDIPSAPGGEADKMPRETEEDKKAGFRVIGEGLATYIIAEHGDTIILIDKHAAHERIIFDRLRAEKRETMAQILLAPAVVKMPPEDAAVILDNGDALRELGFEIDRFGEDSIAVRQVPADMDTGEIGAMLGEICYKLRLQAGAGAGERRDNILHTVACKAAIKAGRRSQPEELEAIVRRVISGEVKYCPHGRPVAMELTKAALDRNFKRA